MDLTMHRIAVRASDEMPALVIFACFPKDVLQAFEGALRCTQ
jgi:hypothetical protein